MMTDQASDITMITQTLNWYMIAMDRGDLTQLRKRVFTRDAHIDLVNKYSVDEYMELLADQQKKIEVQHFLFNTVADITGDSATTISYFIGYHRVPGGDLGPANAAFFGVSADPIVSVIGGRYDDVMERTADGWRIKVRKVTLLWQQQGPMGQVMKPDWLRS